jgi:hypothetical protein
LTELRGHPACTVKKVGRICSKYLKSFRGP